MGQFADNIEENEQTMGLSTPPTTTDDDGGSSAGGISQYEDDEELDVDDLDERPTAIYRLENYGTLHYAPWDGSTSNPDIYVFIFLYIINVISLNFTSIIKHIFKVT